MFEDLIVPRSPAQPRRDAAEGTVYYSCERFEDAYGRLVVGIGARLEGRALEHVLKAVGKSVYVSSAAMQDGVRFRAAMREARQRDTHLGPSLAADRHDLAGGVWDQASAPFRQAVGEAMQLVHRISPELAGLIQELRPYPRDLMHGVQVGLYARRLVTAYNHARESGLLAAKYPYSARARDEVFLAGVLHDIGRWTDRPEEGHTDVGASLLERLAARLPMLNTIAAIVAQHHSSLSDLSGGVWEVHKAAPVVLSEAIVDSPGTHVAAVWRLVPQGAPEGVESLLVTLCNLEGVAPPRVVLRVGEGNASDLAVSLRVPDDDPYKPYLLSFARWRNGRPFPLLSAKLSALRCLTAPGHASWSRRREVISLLPDVVYEARFSRYERLLPTFRGQLWSRLRSTGTPAELTPSSAGNDSTTTEQGVETSTAKRQKTGC